MIKIIKKTPEKVVFISDLDSSLANAIRRSVNEIPIMAIDEVDIYKNDSALNDNILAHRIGLVPLKNQKSKKDVELKIQAQGKEVLSKELGEMVVYKEIPIVLLEKDQELEVVARARLGTGKEHAKFCPGLVYYKNMTKLEITKEGEKHKELAEVYPETFEFDTKLKIKSELTDLDSDDLKDYPGIKSEDTGNIIFYIESWGQISAEEIFTESIKTLNDNFDELLKALK